MSTRWCLPCATATPPRRQVPAIGSYDGDYSCHACWQTLSHGGTVGEWIPFAASQPAPALTATVRNGKRGKLSVRVRERAELASAPQRPTEDRLNPRLSQEEKLMPKRTPPNVGAAVEKDLAAGGKPAAIAKKHGISAATVYAIRKSMPARHAAPVAAQAYPVDHIGAAIKTPFPSASLPAPGTVTIPIEVDDDLAQQIFRRLPLELKARALSAVMQSVVAP